MGFLLSLLEFESLIRSSFLTQFGQNRYHNQFKLFHNFSNIGPNRPSPVSISSVHSKKPVLTSLNWDRFGTSLDPSLDRFLYIKVTILLYLLLLLFLCSRNAREGVGDDEEGPSVSHFVWGKAGVVVRGENSFLTTNARESGWLMQPLCLPFCVKEVVVRGKTPPSYLLRGRVGGRQWHSPPSHIVWGRAGMVVRGENPSLATNAREGGWSAVCSVWGRAVVVRGEKHLLRVRVGGCLSHVSCEGGQECERRKPSFAMNVRKGLVKEYLWHDKEGFPPSCHVKTCGDGWVS